MTYSSASSTSRLRSFVSATACRPRGAESRNDFVHKLKIAHKELNESGVWLRIVSQADLLPPGDVASVESECDALCRIVGASIKTTTTNGRKRRRMVN